MTRTTGHRDQPRPGPARAPRCRLGLQGWHASGRRRSRAALRCQAELYLLRQIFLLILLPFRLTDFFDGAGTNVWGRPLSDGKSYVVAFVNNAAASGSVECDAACFAALFDGAAPASSAPQARHPTLSSALSSDSFVFAQSTPSRICGARRSRWSRWTRSTVRSTRPACRATGAAASSR